MLIIQTSANRFFGRIVLKKNYSKLALIKLFNISLHIGYVFFGRTHIQNRLYLL